MPSRSTFATQALRRATPGVLALVVLACSGPVPPAAEPPAAERPTLRYDREYPFVDYGGAELAGRVADLRAALSAGTAALDFGAGSGYLKSLLAALDIDPSSQVLVFSKTSLQVAGIAPATPRAIYFNDDTYVAYVPGAGTLEIATLDPGIGQIFFTLPQQAGARLERETQRCLRCHDSYSLTGGGVPRFILGSGYIGTDGQLVSHEAWILTSTATPFASRWGGWYVTGQHGSMRHLGNVIVEDIAQLEDLDSLRVGNLDSLDGLVDTSPYLTPYSDIVALLVLEHQVQVQNAMTRASYDVKSMLYEQTATPERIAAAAEPLVEALFFVAEPTFADPIVSSSGFDRWFETGGPTDASGRSLRELALDERLFRYRLSHLVYSQAFDALPAELGRELRRRIGEVLRGDDESERFAHLSSDERSAIMEILSATKPELLSEAGARAAAAASAGSLEAAR